VNPKVYDGFPERSIDSRKPQAADHVVGSTSLRLPAYGLARFAAPPSNSLAAWRQSIRRRPLSGRRPLGRLDTLKRGHSGAGAMWSVNNMKGADS